MMKLFFLSRILHLGIVALLAIPLAQAQSITPDAAASAARRATNGRVLSVRQDQRGQPSDYRVKVLTKDGRVRMIRVDGRTGRAK